MKWISAFLGGHLLLGWLPGLPVEAQDAPVDVLVHGVVKDRFTDVPKAGVRVGLSVADNSRAETSTQLDGYYEFTLGDRLNYTIRFEAEGMAPKWCTIDLRGMPAGDTSIHGMEVNMRMHPPLAGVPGPMRELPMGRAAWSPSDSSIAWDLEHTASIQVVLDSLTDQHLAAHPEEGPNGWTRTQVKTWEWLVEYSGPAVLLVVAAWWVMSQLLIRALGFHAVQGFLLINFLACALVVYLLRDAAGPLRHVGLMAFVIGVFAFLMGPLIQLVVLVGRLRSTARKEPHPNDGYFIE